MLIVRDDSDFGEILWEAVLKVFKAAIIFLVIMQARRKAWSMLMKSNNMRNFSPIGWVGLL